VPADTPPPGDSGDARQGPVDQPDQQGWPFEPESPPERAEANFFGHRRPELHRTVGPHRAWCECSTWCYPNTPCWCCLEALTEERTPRELEPCCKAVWPLLDLCPDHAWKLHAHPRLVIWTVAADTTVTPRISPAHPVHGDAQRSAAGNRVIDE
jgi:hypothetical protein